MMIEVLSAPKNVAAFRLAGTVTSDDYREVIETIEAKLRNNENIGVYVDASDYQRMTAAAIRTRIRYGIRSLGQRHRFKRTGIVTNKTWLSRAAWLADRAFPKIEVRAFEEGRNDDALRWVSDVHSR